MTCPICGKTSPCVHARRRTSVLVDHRGDHEIFAGEQASPAPSPGAVLRAGDPRPVVEHAWRQEVVSRVQQHRARRRRPADPNALELDFSADAPYSFGDEPHASRMPPPPERFAEIMIPQSPARQQPPKVIRFPRSQPAYVPTVEEVRLDDLAEPVLESPRIVEAFEPEVFEPEAADPGRVQTSPAAAAAFESQQMELLPSFADIELEPEEARTDEDLDVIPRPAPLSQRFVAGLVDATIAFIATGVFAFAFVQLAEEMPPSRMALVCMLVAGGIFWLLLQYIFLTFRRATPGMSVAHLELCTFAGTATSMFDRQCRAMASALSGFSLGLGYAWALVDEDRLGWHDRISQTYVRALSTIPTLSLSKGREPYIHDEP